MQDRIQAALDYAFRYGQIGGDHHRLWVIDKMVRALCGTEEEYERWVAEYEEGGEYEWETGIAP